ncbi:MAG: glycosyltransferase family A protein [Nitrososphaerota archaeon]
MFKTISEPKLLSAPYISVVVTAYDRKDFILEAVQSVIDQTLERSKYEIIVVKNYLDEQIDEFLKRNSVLNVYTDEKSLGSKLAYGIDKAHGEIVSFLDDDDLYLPFKLREVYQVFLENKDIIYFRNEIIPTRKVEEVKNRFSEIEKMAPKRKTFRISKLNSSRKIFHVQEKYGVANMSSVSVRKSCYQQFSQSMFEINQMAEFYLFFIGFLTDDQNIISFQEKPLSIWRIHESWTNYDTNTTKRQFLSKNLEVSKDVALSYENFIKIIASMSNGSRNVQVLLKNIATRLDGWRAKIKLAENIKCNMREICALIKSGFYLKDHKILLTVPVSIFSLLSPNYAGKIFRWGLTREQFHKL